MQDERRAAFFFFRFERSPVYTIRVDSFADSDGDGAGDLVGIIDKLGYIKNDISIDAVALEGLLEKNDLTAIQPRQGSESDLKNLASQIKVGVSHSFSLPPSVRNSILDEPIYLRMCLDEQVGLIHLVNNN